MDLGAQIDEFGVEAIRTTVVFAGPPEDDIDWADVSRFHVVFADWLTVVCFVGLLAAALFGSYFVQTAYSTGSPSVMVAGLTVIDPMVGVTIGIVVLGEAATAPWWAPIVFALAGLVAVLGVYRLSRHSPAALASSGETSSASPQWRGESMMQPSLHRVQIASPASL